MTNHDDLVDSWRDEFRDLYDGDPRNAARQPFRDYWGWVRTFLLTGGAGQRSWLAQGDETLRRVRDTAEAERLRARMLALGKAIAAEWAKDSGARRIHSTFLQGSPNLQTWGRLLQRAAEADAGDGVAIRGALDAIDREVRGALEA